MECFCLFCGLRTLLKTLLALEHVRFSNNCKEVSYKSYFSLYGRLVDSAVCLMSYGLALGSPARNRQLDSMIVMGPFQLEIFCDSIMAAEY